MTNRIYVSNFTSKDVTVIDGATSSVMATVPVGVSATGMSVDVAANRIHVAGWASNISTIDGTNNTVMSLVAVGSGPIGLALNEATGKLYSADFFGNTVSVVVE